MAFHIKNHEPIGKELRRLARDEFQTAIAELSRNRDGDAIHEARKSLKKLRAVLRLVQPNLANYREKNEQLRTAAHALAALRDADATAETVEMLHGRYPTIITATVATALVSELRRRSREVEARATRVLNRSLRILRSMGRSLPAAVEDAAASRVVRTATIRGYRRARNALSDLNVEADAAQFHLLRRRLKNHWYQMRLLECVHSTPRNRARKLKRLDTWLGDDHNLAILQTTLLNAPPHDQTAETNTLVLGCIVKRQATLRARALKASHRLLQAKPRDFKHSVRLWCRNGR